MAEVVLLWYQMTDESVIANRGQARRWADELALPSGPLSKNNSVLALYKAGEFAQVEFDNQGEAWVLVAKMTAKNDNFITFTVNGRSAGGSKRLGEVKLFRTRRTAVGMVEDSERIKTLIARSANEVETVAMERYLAQFQELYEEFQGVAPPIAVRHIVRQHLVAHGFPVGRAKGGIYFTYVDRLPVIRRAEEFLRRCAPQAQLIILPIEGGAEQHSLFVQSADVHVETQINALNLKIDLRERSQAAAKRVVAWRAELERWQAAIEEHELRLGQPLSAARVQLELGFSAVHRVDPTADLLSVTNR